jgi:retron-type reverse transcriptase
VSAQRARSTFDKARQLQRALYRAAKASPARRFHALYDKMLREDVLAKAWREVKANAGSAGVDGQTIEQIEQQGVEGLLSELEAELHEGRYRPHAVRRVRIPKQRLRSAQWSRQWRLSTSSLSKLTPRLPRLL